MSRMTASTWPLFDLRVFTPLVTMRYVTDELGERLAELAADGIHDPAVMPFSDPWTDVDPPELQRNALRYFWRCRAETTERHWALVFAVQDRQGQLVGQCQISADDYPDHRTATTGSWVGRRYQGRGLGREVRHAALHLIFAGLRGERARTGAWHDNAASLAVTRSLPYTEEATTVLLRRGRPDDMRCFAMDRRRWLSIRRDDIELVGVRQAADFLRVEA